MAGLYARDGQSETPALRREVIVPKARDALAFHRRIAVLSVLIAMLAGSLDAMLWREAQRDAERRQAAAAELAEREAAEARVLMLVEHAGANVHGEEVRQCPHDRAAH